MLHFTGRIIVIALSTALLGGCLIGGPGNSSGDPTSSGGSAGSANASNAGTPEPKKTAEPAKQVSKLEFDAAALPKELNFEGKIKSGARWSDSNGENILIVTEKTDRGADISTQRIWGYHYVVQDGGTKLLWKIQDYAENYCDAGKGLTSPVEVRDIDGDGVAESMFVYNIAGGCDVSPIPYKLMMHSGETKLAVRGANAVEIPGYKTRSEKNFDEAFERAPKEFRTAASEFWDKHVKPLRAE